jgi:hypothetical protein
LWRKTPKNDTPASLFAIHFGEFLEATVETKEARQQSRRIEKDPSNSLFTNCNTEDAHKNS